MSWAGKFECCCMGAVVESMFFDGKKLNKVSWPIKKYGNVKVTCVALPAIAVVEYMLFNGIKLNKVCWPMKNYGYVKVYGYSLVLII